MHMSRAWAVESAPALRKTPASIGRAAVVALYDEVALYPKPGLVSFVDAGSHSDMDARTFMRSLFALRHYFQQIAALGALGAPFAALERCGQDAEARMLGATGGINTHRGAIFTLGLLCAAAGAASASGGRLHADLVRQTLCAHWGDALRTRAHRTSQLPGGRAAQAHGLRSASQEAALGFPTLFETTFPALEAAFQRGHGARWSRLQALMRTMATLDDCNLAHRGGMAGLRFAQAQAHAFLAHGVEPSANDPADRLQAMHRAFIDRRLSPGGSADMLAAACWLRRICQQD